MAITSKIWNALDKRDRALLEQLGLKPKIRPSPAPRKFKPPVPYCLKILTICTLCGSKPIQYLRMKHTLLLYRLLRKKQILVNADRRRHTQVPARTATKCLSRSGRRKIW